MKRLIAIAGFLLAVASPAAADNTSSSSYVTPGGNRVMERGGCLLVQARQGLQAVTRDDSWCDARGSASGPSMRSAYAWLPDFVVTAFDEAERARCAGHVPGCIVAGRDVRIAIVRDGIPNAGVATNKNGRSVELDVFITTGLVDFVESAEMTYLDEAQAQVTGHTGTVGLTAWLAAIDGLGGRPCNLRVPSPLRQVSPATFTLLRTMAQTFYEFVMSHELGHVASMPSAGCGVATQGMARELACDADAFTHLASTSRGPARMIPPAIVAPLVAMSHYETLMNNQLGFMAAPQLGTTFLDIFPASNWTTRATEYVNRWERYCSTSPPGAATTTCRPGWRGAVGDARRLLGIQLPAACLTSSVSAAQNPVGSLSSPTPSSFCTGVTDLVSAAGGRFHNITGPVTYRDTDTTMYSSRVVVPGATNCEVWHDTSDQPPDDSVKCTWYKGTDVAVARATYQSLVQDVGKCFGPGWSFQSRTSSTGDRYYGSPTTGLAHTVRVQRSGGATGRNWVYLSVESGAP